MGGSLSTKKIKKKSQYLGLRKRERKTYFLKVDFGDFVIAIFQGRIVDVFGRCLRVDH
jgi:hypothetical protein